ncbi:MAG TPA: GIY-YIG nuclease family protein [Verrucomicrobiae bacterium]|nr:GIY-YIG nuclease family protein [Verrucomicrobiae bacterium]
MKFIEAVVEIIRSAGIPLTPPQIRDRIKVKYPQFYNTEKHKQQVDKGNYQNFDHALMAQVYGLARNSSFICDRSVKPMKLSLEGDAVPEYDQEEDIVSPESIENDIGSIYILKTGTYTKEGKEIVKIGITSGEVDQRVAQLYTTGVPHRFEIHQVHKVSGFIELEKSLHALLYKFRLNSSREFFTEDAIVFVDRIVSIHKEIKGA